ncbi:MAG TPA: hypothetical protein DFL85_15525 [Lentisphaeria bacterium]|nr:hypothetical protein C5Q97_12675 [Victivallales bacterium CCUG 44730]HBP05432.1 hypothetical protein [Lentisphaeria bacterium]HCH86908.1 hypothetical protein [Lentisphaeria bacterium]
MIATRSFFGASAFFTVAFFAGAFLTGAFAGAFAGAFFAAAALVAISRIPFLIVQGSTLSLLYRSILRIASGCIPPDRFFARKINPRRAPGTAFRLRGPFSHFGCAAIRWDFRCFSVFFQIAY